jgi:hypothetical protein
MSAAADRLLSIADDQHLAEQQGRHALWAIIAVVWVMDFLSAEVRKRYT